jgi:TPR repeat protein
VVEFFSAPRCTVAAGLLLACAVSTAAPTQIANDVLSARLVVVERMLDGDMDEGRLLDLKALIESLPFVERGDRKQARAANTEGLKWFDAGDYDKAAAAFERGVRFDPADQEISNNLAFAYFRGCKTEQAWQAIKRTLALAPARTSACANIGEMRAAEGDQVASAWSFVNSYRFSRKPETTRAYFAKLKAETEDTALQADLTAALAVIDSGVVKNLIDHPMPIGESSSRIAKAKDPTASDTDEEDELRGIFDRVRGNGDTSEFPKIQAAANRGLPLAQAMLGEAYRNGQGVVDDLALSVTWYRRAAEQGNADAQYQLGLAYQEGRGVEKNYQTAAHWYAQAAAQGESWAMNNLGAIYDRGQIGKADPARAAKLYRQASDLGNPQASYNLAIDYADGKGVPKDLAESARLYLLSANGGFIEAQIEVADNYEKGRGVPKDEAQALLWYRKAAAAGVEYAREVLRRKGVAE